MCREISKPVLLRDGELYTVPHMLDGVLGFNLDNDKQLPDRVEFYIDSEMVGSVTELFRENRIPFGWEQTGSDSSWVCTNMYPFLCVSDKKLQIRLVGTDCKVSFLYNYYGIRSREYYQNHDTIVTFNKKPVLSVPAVSNSRHATVARVSRALAVSHL